VRIKAEDERLRAEAVTSKSAASTAESPGFGVIFGIAAILGLIFILRKKG